MLKGHMSFLLVSYLFFFLSLVLKMDERTDGLNHSGRKMTSLLGSGTTLLEIGLVMLMINAYDSAFRASYGLMIYCFSRHIL